MDSERERDRQRWIVREREIDREMRERERDERAKERKKESK